MELHQWYESSFIPMGIRKCSVHYRHVAHIPDGPTSSIDTAPRAFRSYPSLNEFLGDGSSAFPLTATPEQP